MGWDPPRTIIFLFLFQWIGGVESVECSKCPYSPEPPHINECPETCEGDVCYIVVNRYFNGTIIAGCLKLRDGDKFGGENVCHREETRTICGCEGSSRCNHPQTPLAEYRFVDEPVFGKYQTLPQLQTVEGQVTPLLVSQSPDEAIEVKAAVFVKDPSQSSTQNPFQSHSSTANDITELAELEKQHFTPVALSEMSTDNQEIKEEIGENSEILEEVSSNPPEISLLTIINHVSTDLGRSSLDPLPSTTPLTNLEYTTSRANDVLQIGSTPQIENNLEASSEKSIQNQIFSTTGSFILESISSDPMEKTTIKTIPENLVLGSVTSTSINDGFIENSSESVKPNEVVVSHTEDSTVTLWPALQNETLNFSTIPEIPANSENPATLFNSKESIQPNDWQSTRNSTETGISSAEAAETSGILEKSGVIENREINSLNLSEKDDRIPESVSQTPDLPGISTIRHLVDGENPFDGIEITTAASSEWLEKSTESLKTTKIPEVNGKKKKPFEITVNAYLETSNGSGIISTIEIERKIVADQEIEISGTHEGLDEKNEKEEMNSNRDLIEKGTVIDDPNSLNDTKLGSTVTPVLEDLSSTISNSDDFSLNSLAEAQKPLNLRPPPINSTLKPLERVSSPVIISRTTGGNMIEIETEKRQSASPGLGTSPGLGGDLGRTNMMSSSNWNSIEETDLHQTRSPKFDRIANRVELDSNEENEKGETSRQEGTTGGSAKYHFIFTFFTIIFSIFMKF